MDAVRTSFLGSIGVVEALLRITAGVESPLILYSSIYGA